MSTTTTESQQDISDITQTLRQWEKDNTTSGYDPIPSLEKLAEIIEKETENFLKMDPDPFDTRHPSRVDPECKLGHIFKAIFRKDDFITKLIEDYMRETYYRNSPNSPDNTKLHIAACRLMLDILPGLDTSAVFFSLDMESFIKRLYVWSEHSNEQLQCYAVGLLAASMEIQDVQLNYREQNSRLVPIMLKKLRDLQSKSEKERLEKERREKERLEKEKLNNDNKLAMKKRKLIIGENEIDEPSSKRAKIDNNTNNNNNNLNNNNDDDDRLNVKASWAEENVIGNMKMYPPTLATQQILILRYLSTMGPHQEFCIHVFEQNALELILSIINIEKTKDIRLTFEGLKYLASLLYQKKFLIEFLNMDGVEKLLNIPRPSIAATGVSICLYYISYCEDAMEQICLMSNNIINKLIKYTLWLLEKSHESSRCYATLFLSYSFSFQIILDEFDKQDGLRILLNAITTLELLNGEEVSLTNDDEEYTARQLIRNVSIVLKKYMEMHLYWKCEELQRIENVLIEQNIKVILPYKSCKLTNYEIQTKIEVLQQLLNIKKSWLPVEEFYKLQGIQLIVKIIATTREWIVTGRIAPFIIETIKSCLDVISICTVVPKVLLLLSKHEAIPNISSSISINLLLAASEGELVSDVEVQKSALTALVNCVCPPLNRPGDDGDDDDNDAKFSFNSNVTMMKKKINYYTYKEIIEKVWNCVRANNGIMMLLELMKIKVPRTDADSIRALACRALAGLSRCEKIRQIISKLPMFIDDGIQTLMKLPILQEKRQEHYTFQKYALELMERVSKGEAKTSRDKTSYQMSLQSLSRANVVAQTKIQYSDQQLNLLLYQHFLSKGLNSTALSLLKEANLDIKTLNNINSNKNQQPKVYSEVAELMNCIPKCSRDAMLKPVSILQTPQARHDSIISGNALHSPIIPARVRKIILNERHHNLINTNNNSYNVQSSLSNETTPMKTNHLRSLQKPIQKNLSICIDEQLTPSSPSSSSTTATATIAMTPTSTPTTLAMTPTTLLNNDNKPVTLNSIVEEYLINQHSLCENPMLTCPQFNLLEPHKCPDSRSKYFTIPINMASRRAQSQWGNIDCSYYDRKYLYSHFCPVKTYRPNEPSTSFTYCIFSPCQKYLMIGTNEGDIKKFNIETGLEEKSYSCHESSIKYAQCNNQGNLLITNTSFRQSALWNIENRFEIKMAFEGETHIEFNKQYDKIIATQTDEAIIYDIETGKIMSKLKPLTIEPNFYKNNKATFSMDDDLVLNDGILWDFNSGKVIHKFDKLNQKLNGVFHPNGLEVISNSEVWDLRTYNLMKTVELLDELEVIFSPINHALYGILCDQENQGEAYFPAFATLDALDYSTISVQDVKPLYSLACNKYDTQIATVQIMSENKLAVESFVKLYDVGRVSADDEPLEEDETDMATDIDDDDDDDDDDSDEDMDDDDDDDDNDDDDDDDDDDEVSNLLEVLPINGELSD